MKALLLSTAASLVLPLIFGALFGWLYPNLGVLNQSRIERGITGLANPDFFNLLALASVFIVSLRVILKGPITPPLSRQETAAMYWLPGVALGCCMPFFAGIAGFILGHPSDPTLRKLAVVAAISFISSAGFLFALLLPAHVSIAPRSPETKSTMYKIVLVSSVGASIWFYGVQQ